MHTYIHTQERYDELQKDDVLAVMRAIFADFENRLVICEGVSGKEYKDMHIDFE